MTPMQDSPVTHIEVFSGASDPAEARVYAVAPSVKTLPHKAVRLTGHLVGPQCKFAHTLPARIPFRTEDSQEISLAEAIVPDPCFWTPELPFLYRAELEIQQSDGQATKFARTIGIRRFGHRGQNLFFDAKRFVLRGVHVTFDGTPTECQLNYLRETWTTVVTPWPTPQLCELASRRGIILIADLRAADRVQQNSAAETMRDIAQWPAAVAALVNPHRIDQVEFRGAIRNILIAQQVNSENPQSIAAQTQLVFAEIGRDPAQLTALAKNGARPVVAVRQLAHPVKIEDARAACDALQRDLAPLADFAGYVV